MSCNRWQVWYRGKSGGVRSILAFKSQQFCFFMYGFSKNEKSNITDYEEKALKLVAKKLLSFSETEINEYILEDKLFEVDYE